MAYLFLTLAAIFRGGNYVVGHVLVQHIDPYTLSLIRWGGNRNVISYFIPIVALICFLEQRCGAYRYNPK